MLNEKLPSSLALPSWWTTRGELPIGLWKTLVALCSALWLASGAWNLQAQTAGEPPTVREPLRPRLLVSFPVGRIRYYELSESTRVERHLPDGTIQSWHRQARYLLRFYAFTEQENQMTAVACRIERLSYRFQQDTLTIAFDSDHPERLSRRVPDVEFVNMLLGTEPEILISPYGDIARIDGEQLQWLRDYVHSELGSDTLRLASRLAAISDARWAALFDLHKGIVPGIRVREDSSWKRLVTLWIEGVEWRDTAHIHIAQTGDTSRVIVGVLPALRTVSTTAWLPDIPRTPVQVDHASGHAQIAVELASGGLITRSELHAHTEYDALPRGGATPFRQTVQVTLSWRFVREE